jgi:hypothetical protein
MLNLNQKGFHKSHGDNQVKKSLIAYLTASIVVKRLTAFGVLAFIAAFALIGLLLAGSSSNTSSIVHPHDRSFVGPSYYSQFSNGPSTRMNYFPIGAWQEDITGTTGAALAQRTAAMGVNFLDMESNACSVDLDAAHTNGLTMQATYSSPSHTCPGSPCGSITHPLGCFSGVLNSDDLWGHTLYDEPNTWSYPYAMETCANRPPILSDPSQDTCAKLAIDNTAALSAADPGRLIFGTLTKDLFPWEEYPPPGWDTANCGTGTNVPVTNGPRGGTTNWRNCFEKHQSMLMSGMSILAADIYGWTDPYEGSDSEIARTGSCGHCGAWVDAYALDRLRYYRSGIPVLAFLSLTHSDHNSMVDTPAMIDADVWDAIAHGARGIIWWTADLASDAPHTPIAGMNCSSYWDAICDSFWRSNYDAAKKADAQIKNNAVALNSPTVTGCSATMASGTPSGTPFATLCKNINGSGQLWMLVTADGDINRQMSNTTTATANITLPNEIPAGTVLDVLGENRTVTVNSRHQFTDTFGTVSISHGADWTCGCTVTFGYQHHIYIMETSGLSS